MQELAAGREENVNVNNYTHTHRRDLFVNVGTDNGLLGVVKFI